MYRDRLLLGLDGRGRGRGGQGRVDGGGGPSAHTVPPATSTPPPPTPPFIPPQPVGPSSSNADEQAHDFDEKLALSAAAPGAPSSSKGLVLASRPGLGTKGKKVKVRANHFAVQIADRDLHHYAVTIKPKVRSMIVEREVISKLVDWYNAKLGGRITAAYDGRKSLFTAGRLPFESEDEVVVQLSRKDNTIPPADKSDSTSTRGRDFKVAVKLAAVVNTYTLRQFLGGQHRDAPHGVIQDLNLVLRAISSKDFAVVGGSLFSPKLGPKGDLGNGVEYWSGYYQSLRPTQMGLSFNIGVSARGFYEPILVTDFVQKYFNIKDISSSLPNEDCLNLKRALEGIMVKSSYRGFDTFYKITGVSTLPMSKIMFLRTGQTTQISVPQYFQERYGLRLKYSSLPALQTGSKRTVYLPMELCTIVEGQRYSKRLNEKQVINLLNANCKRPDEQESKIMEAKTKCNFDKKELSTKFGISMDNELTLVDARILPPPLLKYHDTGKMKKTTPRFGRWDMVDKKMVNGGTVKRWTCVNFSELVTEQQASAFCQKLIEMCCSKGVDFSKDPIIPIRSADFGQIKNALEDISKACAGLQLLIIILPDKGGFYGTIKRVCETELGIISQCCQPKKLGLGPQYLEGVALKINVKAGGRNTVLNDAILEKIPLEVPTIIFGSDVTHPSPGDCSAPSIAAVVASIDWPGVTTYRGLVSAQAHGVEIIQGLYTEHNASPGGMIRDLLLQFIANNNTKPDRIIFYRDGVGESQFSQVLLYEIDAIRKACASIKANYQPRITFVVVQKRHHTRFFPADKGRKDQMDRGGNILPGTVVDSQICHPTEFDFYLKSHAGFKGTSRPSHYYVLYDENRFTADQLQTLTNNLCYTYVKCTSSLSVVPPVYYAHLAAYRARYYIEKETSDDVGSSSSRGAAAGTIPEVPALPTIKENVKNVMFYC